MTAGASAAAKAAAIRRAAERARLGAERAARVAAAWEAGSRGEVVLGGVLESLRVDGYTHLPDRAVPGSRANIDHIVVGPAGVFVIDAKAWTGDLRCDRGVLWQNDRRRDDEVESARATAKAIAAALDDLPARVDVRPALCFVGEARLGEAHFVDRVKLIDVEELLAWVRRWPRKLDASNVHETCQRLLSAFPAKTGEPASIVTAEAPTDLVVYLVPWKKAGKHRLYVRSPEGADVGYLDLVSGRWTSPTREWEAVLAQLLPHYLKGDVPGMRDQDLSDEERGVIRRFLDAFKVTRSQTPSPMRPIIACYRWKKHGKDRLYLSRLLPSGEKVELGSFDLDTGRLQANGPGVAATLGYCGQKFQELEQRRLPQS